MGNIVNDLSATSISNDGEKIRIYYGYTMELRGVLDRFQANIESCQVSYKSVEAQKSTLEQDKKGNALLMFINLLLCLGMVVFIIVFFNIVILLCGSIVAVALIVYTVWVWRGYKRAKIKYRVFTEHKKYKPMIDKEKIATYYNQTEYYSGCISDFKRKQKPYLDLLKKLEAQEELTEKEICMLDDMKNIDFSCPENPYKSFKM